MSNNGRQKKDNLRVFARTVVKEVKGYVADYPYLSYSQLHDKAGNEELICGKDEKALIYTVQSDTYDAGADLLKEGLNPLVLNMASDFKAGGGWLNGADAQEESLCFRSTLSATLHPKYYRLTASEVIYSPSVFVYRSSNKYTKRLKSEECFEIAVVSSAAIRHPRLVNGTMSVQDYKLAKMKIRNILSVGLIHGHDSIVLSAYGCGAFRNPPADIAQAFEEVIKEEEYDKMYKKIVFGILDKSSYDNNVEVFSKRFPLQ